MRFKDAMYYAVAGLLLLASVPIYRVIFKYAGQPAGVSADTRPATPPQPREWVYGAIPADAVRIWTGTTSECSHGVLLWHGPKGTTVVTMDGQPVACLQPVPKLVRK